MVQTVYLTLILTVFTWRGQACEVRMTTDAGAVCGLIRKTRHNTTFAQFLAVPYAKQPLGELRFKELQPADPWEGDFDATAVGPICPQTDRLYGRLVTNTNMSEACIHANVYVPADALSGDHTALPIIVHIHGGGFQAGSGDPDIHGPEYMLSERVVFITFNYRLNVFGFLSLNSPSIPGNQGLRDVITLLKWVQSNAAAFGGDPDNVSLLGQSAGASMAHLLSLSSATEGLFRRVALLSGTGLPAFYTASPVYAQAVAKQFLAALNITATDPEEIHQQLIAVPLKNIVTVNKALQDVTGLVSFTPVVETPFENVTTVIDADPETLIKNGRGKDYPTMIGFATLECASLQGRLDELMYQTKITENPAMVLFSNLLYTLPNETQIELGKEVIAKYSMAGSLNMLQVCSDTYFMYPAMKLARMRAEMGAETYLYQFAYEGEYRVIEEAFQLKFNGTAHLEDISYLFRTNSMYNASVSRDTPNDDLMNSWIVELLTNFARSSYPASSKEWPAVESTNLMYQNILVPDKYSYVALTEAQQEMFTFFQGIDAASAAS